MNSYGNPEARQLLLASRKNPLPCDEATWSAANNPEWRKLIQGRQCRKIVNEICLKSLATPSIQRALDSLYIEKSMPNLGEFSQIIVLHAVFEETWKVSSFYERPMSLWIPSATRAAIPAPSEARIASNPTYSKWRNAACDCFDVLHWYANSKIAQASGVEHPTVIQLHLARVVLLAPCASLRALANFLSSRPNFSRAEMPSEIQAAEKDIIHWVCSDYHKARLSMIHAGMVFWHVRRYSRRAFYEPNAVYLATLAVWAYGLFAARSSMNSNLPSRSRSGTSSPTNEQNDDDMPSFVRLDRPCDDELVQWYIRYGSPERMTASITRVGNVCSSKGPTRMLREGASILTQLGKIWSIANNQAEICTLMTQYESYITR